MGNVSVRDWSTWSNVDVDNFFPKKIDPAGAY